MVLIIETNLKNSDGAEKEFAFSYDGSNKHQVEYEWLEELLTAKNAHKSLIIKGTLIDTQYVTNAYIR